MADQKPKRPRDMNKLAKSIVDIATGEEQPDQPVKENISKIRAKAGKKGAKARVKNLSERERMEIAHIAANARWKKKVD